MQQAHDHLEAVDPLMIAINFEIVDPNLMAEHYSTIRELFDEFSQEKKKASADGIPFNRYRRTDKFNRLRREVAYCITDHYRM